MKTIVYVLFASIALSSCSPKLVPFSQRMVEDFSWTEDDLKRIQFYLSEDITIYRETRANASRIENGAVRIRGGQKVEEITFMKGTPGVFIYSPKEDRMAVCFEEDDDKFLLFGPNSKIGDRYAIMAKDWSGSQGVILYGGEEYYISNNDGLASLNIDLDKVSTTSVSNKRARGREIR